MKIWVDNKYNFGEDNWFGFPIRIPFMFFKNEDINKTIVETPSLWDKYIWITDVELQGITGALIYNSNEAKSKAKRIDEFEKLLQAKNYVAIWKIIITDNDHPDFTVDKANNAYEKLSSDFCHWSSIPEEAQKKLLTNVDFLEIGYNERVEVNLWSALSVLMRNIEDTIVLDEDIWKTFYGKDKFLSALLWSSWKAKEKLSSTEELKSLLDLWMYDSIINLIHDNDTLQMSIVSNKELFETLITKWLRRALYEITWRSNKNLSKGKIFNDDYLFSLCLQNWITIDCMLHAQEKVDVNEKFTNNLYFRKLALQNLDEYTLMHILESAETKWEEVDNEVLQHFANNGYSELLRFLKNNEMYKLEIPESNDENKIGGGYISKDVKLILG